jgi:hypothetical protein
MERAIARPGAPAVAGLIEMERDAVTAEVADIGRAGTVDVGGAQRRWSNRSGPRQAPCVRAVPAIAGEVAATILDHWTVVYLARPTGPRGLHDPPSSSPHHREHDDGSPRSRPCERLATSLVSQLIGTTSSILACG